MKMRSMPHISTELDKTSDINIVVRAAAVFLGLMLCTATSVCCPTQYYNKEKCVLTS